MTDNAGSIASVCGLALAISSVSVNPSKSTTPIHLLPRFPDCSSSSPRDWRVPVEAPSTMWLIHVVNAFEAYDDIGNQQIDVHASFCSYEWFSYKKLFGYDWQRHKLDPSIMNANEHGHESLPRLLQVSMNLDADGNCEKCSVEPFNQWSKLTDFPVINPKFSGCKYKYVYAATSSGSYRTLAHFPFDTILKLNLSENSVHSWTVGSRRFIGEPMFVPKGSEEDDGYLIVVEYAVAVQKCYLVILNPRRIGKDDAPVARLEVPKHLKFPMVSTVFGPVIVEVQHI